MFLDLLARAGFEGDLLAVTVRHKDQGCKAVWLLRAADRRPGSLSIQTGLVKKPLFDKKNVGVQDNFVFLDAGCCYVPYLDEGNGFANAEPDIVHLGLEVGDDLGQNLAP